MSPLSPSSEVAFVAAVVVGFMLAEWRLSLRNEKTLRAAGAVEPRGDVYRAMAVLYPASFVLMAIEGAWRASSSAAPISGPSWAASGIVLFAASKGLKYWAIRSLGERWSFRVLVQPGRPLVRTGPYAFLAHPNYVAVVGELAATAMMVGAPVSGPIMLLAFGVVLWRRVQFESGVLTVGSEPFSTVRVEKGTERVAVSATSDQRKA
jgi:methyltransferase